MKQDETNAKVHAALKEYALKYFDAVIKRNTNADGECWLKPGNYSANDLADHRKANCGMYATPDEREFKQDITISVNTFECVFPYDKIFLILARWENMMRIGKNKVVFEIGDIEERTAKVLLNERTPSGELKLKSIKMVKLVGNWWMPKRVKKIGPTNLIYDLNGICFYPGAQMFHSNLQDKRENAELKERWGRIADARIIELLGKAIESSQDAQGDVYFDYWRKVAELAGLSFDADKDSAKQSETAEISTNAVEAENLPTESANASESNVNTEIADIDTLPTVAEYDAAQKHFADSEADNLAKAEIERVWGTTEDTESSQTVEEPTNGRDLCYIEFPTEADCIHPLPENDAPTGENETPTTKAVAAPSISPTNVVEAAKAVDLVNAETTKDAEPPGKHTTTTERVRTELITAYLLALALIASIWPYKPPISMQVENLPPPKAKRAKTSKKRQIWNVCRPRPLRHGTRPIFSGVLAPPGNTYHAVAALADSRKPKEPPPKEECGQRFAPT